MTQTVTALMESRRVAGEPVPRRFQPTGRTATLGLAAMCMVFLADGHGSGARAVELRNAEQTLQYQVIDQNVGGVLAGIAAQAGLHADVSAQIHGDVRGRLPALGIRAMLDRLAALYNFDWYSDGQTLHVSSSAETEHKILPLGAVSADELSATLASLDITDARWPLRIAPQGDLVFVNGPPRYVALVEEALTGLTARTHNPGTQVSVFRGVVAVGL